MKRYSFIMRWNSSFISLSNNEEIFFQYDVESLHIYAVAVHSCFSECRVIMAVSVVVSLVVVTFITVNFVIGHSLNMHNIAPHGTPATEALINSSAVVQECSPKDK